VDEKYHDDTVDDAAEFQIDEIFNVTGTGLVVSGTVAYGSITVAGEGSSSSAKDTVMLLGPFSDASHKSTFRAVVVRSIHFKRQNIETATTGMSCAVAIRAKKKGGELRREHIRRGMILLRLPSHAKGKKQDALDEDKLIPSSLVRIGEDAAASEVFESDVLILHHPTTIKHHYQAVVHLGQVRQTAQLVFVGDQQHLRTGDRARVRFRFIQRAEWAHVGQSFIFREGSTKGVGKITRVVFTAEELTSHLIEEKRITELLQHQHMEQQQDQPLSDASVILN